MSGKQIYSNPYFSADDNVRPRDDNSSEDSERSEPPVWESAVDSRGELFYADVEEVPPSPASSGHREPGELRAPSSPAARPPAPASAAGKLRQLLRRRRSQRAGRSELSVAAPVSPARRAPAGPAERAATASPAGEVYRVVVRLDSERPAALQNAPLCESLLGVIGRHQLQQADTASSPQTVTVAALAPRGPLVRSPLVRIGDSLERVNGVPVSPASLQAVLTALPRPGKVRLSFRRAVPQSATTSEATPSLTNGIVRQATSGGGSDSGAGNGPTTADTTTGTTVTTTAGTITTTGITSAGDGRVTNLTGDGLSLEQLGQLLRDVPHGLLCLNTEGLTETSGEREDIVYQFPGYDTALVSARGSLLTVAGLTKQISGDTPLRAAVTVGTTAVHVAVACQEDLVLLLAAPESSLSAPELHQLGTELWQLLRLEFGSLRSL